MCVYGINCMTSHDVSSSVKRNSFYIGKYILILVFWFCYEVYEYKSDTKNRGRFFSAHVSSRLFSPNATGWFFITHFPDSALTRLDFAATVFISCSYLSYTCGSSGATDVNFNVDQHPNLLRLCLVKQILIVGPSIL
jgi:hypothetical protein